MSENDNLHNEQDNNEHDGQDRQEDHIEHVGQDDRVEQDDYFEDYDHNAWTATGPMADLPTKIFKDNALSASSRRNILQNQPKNKDISFTPPDMDRRMWSHMSRTSREHDKDVRKLLYRFSSVLRPLDNTIRFIYASKPDEGAQQSAKDAWNLLERNALNSRSLLLDSLSFGNELRREQALKSVVPGYKNNPEREEVFGNDLSSIIQKENETNKLFNDAAWQKRRSNQNFRGNSSRTQQNSSITFRSPSGSQGYRGKKKYWNYQNYHKDSQGQGNYNNGGQQNRQSEQ